MAPATAFGARPAGGVAAHGMEEALTAGYTKRRSEPRALCGSSAAFVFPFSLKAFPVNSNTRTRVLLGLLAVLGAAGLYDFFYARPLATKIREEIEQFAADALVNKNPESEKPTLHTPADIHKMLGEKFRGGKEYLPSKVTVVPPHSLVETYSVMGGAVFRTHDVHVIYTASNPEAAKEGRSEARFSTVIQGEFPQADLLPTVEMAKNPSDAPAVPLQGASGPGGGGGRPRRQAEGEEPKEEEKKDGESKSEDEAKPEGDKKPAEEKPEEEKPEGDKPTEDPPSEEPPSGDNPG